MTAAYELDCTDCPFRRTVVGEFPAAMDTVETHRSERTAGSTAHFVNVHRR